MTHRRTEPTFSPSLVTICSVTAPSASVGAVDTRLCACAGQLSSSLSSPEDPSSLRRLSSAATGAAGHVSSYRMVPSASITCRPMSSDVMVESLSEARSERLHKPLVS